jgi:ADP-ribosylglycohydrolase
VFQPFCSRDSFEAILVDAVNLRGDADFMGSIAGMLGGAV